MENVILSNMCMICDAKGKVVVQNRKGPNWPGIAFHGGHIEYGESVVDSVIRKVYEETDLPDIFTSDGMKEKYNMFITDSFSKYFYYKENGEWNETLK